MFETSGIRLFSVRGIDVHLSMTFLFIMFFLLLFYGLGGALGLAVSVLIHEFGHAIVSKRYRLQPYIVLHGFGGVCVHRPASTDGQDFLIVVMGPLVQIGAGLLVLPLLLSAALGGLGASMVGAQVQMFLTAFVWVSLIWGGLNLLVPLWPLDGGRLFNLLLRRFMSESKAQVWTLRTSMAVLLPAVAAVAYFREIFLGIIVALLLWQNYQALSSGRDINYGRRSGRTKASPFSKELLAKAKKAMAREDWREAARLCHQLRASGHAIPNRLMHSIWEILGLATLELGKHEEALSYLKRAKPSKKVRDAMERCERELSA